MISLDAVRVFKCLADDTRLMLMLLILREDEFCVCELTHALDESQPKVSRHLAQLRNCGLLIDRRDGQWVYYCLAPVLPRWIEDVLKAAQQGQTERLALLQNRLASMGNRPERRFSMC